MEQEFTYYAFISYSHKDAQFANKLQHYLEHYKLPSVLCRKFPHIPKQLRPVFIDSAELEINELTEALTQALNSSRYLIVICSENSAKPNAKGVNWIDREVRTFLSLRPENYKRVIPIILRKEGGARASECLLPAIQERGILGADMLEKGEERTLNDVVAKMAGLKPDMLWDRHQRELRAQRLRRRIGGGIAAVLAAVAGWWYWEHYVHHFSYYMDYTIINPLGCSPQPRGLFQLKANEANKRTNPQRNVTLIRMENDVCTMMNTPK